ncbi:GOLPH3/VPS74 family protein [Nonomuraea insulae]|uniref:GPP34 family phosphoprotein n=1 Tax=Nonomuraea insulae TaxID=1616787 RepID=A0ABW1CE51_9ACTN
MRVTIAEELLLLAHSDDKGKQIINTTQLDPAVAGALLAELAVTDRVELTKKKVTIKDPTPLGDEELDALLARIADKSAPRSPAWRLSKLQSGKLRKRLLTRLATTGVLTEQQSTVLGLFPVTRWPEADPSVEANVKERVSAVLTGADPDPRTAVLIAIVHAAKLDRKAFPGADRARVKQIAKGEWAGDAVAKTIAAANAAAVAAITAATSAATTASSGS